MLKLFTFITILFYSLSCYSLVGVGSMSPFLGKYTNSTDGGTESALSIWPYISVHEYFNIRNNVFFIPEVGMTFSNSSYGEIDALNGNGDEASSRQMIFGLANFSLMLGKGTHFRFGGGVFITKISGDGGAVTRNNGASTATHYLPDETVSSYNSTLNLGLEKFVAPRMAIKLETYTWNVFDSTSIRFNFALAFNYYL
jgi:hypothetical protein